MPSALQGFERSETTETPKLLLYSVVCGLAAPCMVGIALSQKLSRWPEAEAPFKLW